MKKKSLTAGLALALTLSLTPAQAANTTYLDVDRAAWYATPIAFCQQHLLMDGVSGDSFHPEEPLTRAALAEALYRMSGSPPEDSRDEDVQNEDAQDEDLQGEDNRDEDAQDEDNRDEDAQDEGNRDEDAQGEDNRDEDTQSEDNREENNLEEDSPFSDVEQYHPNYTAICWAKKHGVISGYLDGTFHPDAPITREEIAVLLWSGREQPEAASETPYTDQEDIGDWALPAVSWAYGARIMTGSPDGTFHPKNNTTRAEGATIVMNYAQTYRGMTYGYTLPDPSPVRENTYLDELYKLDEETGYLSYLGMNSIRGIDVSAHQKEIDWSRVAASGMRFAMIRAGYRGYTLGAIQKDAYFDANMRGALSNGMEVGVYFFSQAVTPAEAEEEARLVLDWIKDYNVTYPVVFDWEEQDHDDSRTQGCDGNTVTACALAFCKVIEDAGYLPMTYGSPKKVYEENLRLEYLQSYPFWLAHYTADTAPTSFRYHYSIWQYTSSGQVDGIDGRVDLNLCLVPDWNSWNSGSGGNSGNYYDWLMPF